MSAGALIALLLTADPDAGTSDAGATLPGALEDLFAEKDDDGKPVLGDPDRVALGRFSPGTRQLIATAADEGRVAGPQHLKLLLSLDLSPQTAEIVFSDNCLLCHSDPAQKPKLRFAADPKAEGTPSHLNLKSVLSDVHFRRGLMCAGCHGGKPGDTAMTQEIGQRWPNKDVRHTDRTWIPQFCARCHADPSFMRNFNPSMPTDQYAKYQESRHGQVLLNEKDSKAAQCVSCHGVHGILGPSSRNSMVHAQAVPQTCGGCHADAAYMAGYHKEDGSPLPTDQLAKFQKSVHGQALLQKGDVSAPACNDCHGSHASQPPAVSSVSQVCRTCHVMNGTLFDGSKHKKEFEKHQWPECEKCHGKHDIQKATDELISDSRDGLCGSCHAEHAGQNATCNDSARYFHATLTSLAKRQHELPIEAERLAERGLDIEPITAAIGELDEAVIQTRARVHTFDRGGFDIGANGGREALIKAEGLLSEAYAEQRYRRNGLLVSIGAMGLLAVTLWLKIRELDARRKRERDSEAKSRQP